MLRKYIFLLVFIVMLLLLTSGGYLVFHAVAFLQSPLLTKPNDTTEQTFIIDIPSGTSVKRLSHTLYKQHVLQHPAYFSLYARLRDQAKRIQAGEYALSYTATPSQILQQLVQGRVIQHSITLVEGMRAIQALSVINHDPNLTHEQPLTMSRVAQLLKIPHKSIEGLLYPDTYVFPKGTSNTVFLQRAYDRLNNILNTAFLTRDPDLTYKTPYEVLIVASLIEKEAAIPKERRLVASVINNRLHKQMPLQIDACVLYGFDYNQLKSKEALTRADLRRKTPYNLYQHYGLPPTPIALVSQDAIDAALHPAKTGYLYYVSKGDGSHYFSSTLKEHQKAVNRYQRGITKSPV